MNSLFALMRLRIIDDDESNGYLIMKKKKFKRLLENFDELSN